MMPLEKSLGITRSRTANLLWLLAALWALFLLASLYFNWLGGFFFDASHAHVQGIDFFPVIRAFLNFTAGHSQYDTFSQPYGPYATWYIYHPLMALIVAPLFAACSPWHAYALWTLASFALMVASAWLILRRTDDPVRKALVALLLTGGFPVFIMLYVGNVQALLVLSITCVFCAVDSLRTEGETPANRALLLTGLLLSLFSKPAVLAMIPLLLMLKPTRRTTLKALGIYAAVSLIFLIVPGLNPAAMPWSTRWTLLTHPEIVSQTMNTFTNGFTIIPAMKDNLIHWLAMAGLADFRLQHIDVYSLPTFLDALFRTHTATALYRLPGLLILEMSLLVSFIRNRAQRLEAALLVLMAASLLVFLSYGLVWEYHYTGLLPIAALFLIRANLTRLEATIAALAAAVWLPSLYFLVRAQDTSNLTTLTLIRLDRVPLVAAVFALLLIRAFQIATQSGLQSHPALTD